MSWFRVNKVFSEIVAGFIPNKLARNRWRGILRYGLFRAMRLKHRLKKDKSQPQYYLTVCAIAKNEGAYFDEWIKWHHDLGVEKFYIYDNESIDNTKEVLEPYIKSGLVEYIFFPGKRRQIPAYDDCLEKHRFDAHWIAVIDLDEFIVPIKDKTIPDFLKRFESFSAVEINWLVYGSGGAKEKKSGTVMERFTQHSLPEHELNRKVKTIVNPRCIFNFIGCHEASRICGKTADSHGSPITKSFNDRSPQHDVIRINHYAVKSYEEFLEKRARGSARSVNQRGLDYFEQFDLNDIKESRI
ncbi:MAG: glycosyltransferase family 92 protein [Bacteroidales bacterium]|nr:glycosyltransferase family 92 protein [Bacteroidales bacterium]